MLHNCVLSWVIYCIFWSASVAQLNARSTGDQEVADSIPTGSATYFRGDFIMK